MNYVQYYDNVLTKKLCEELIDKFENSSSEYETHSNNTMSFTQINLNQNKTWHQYIQPPATIFSSCIAQYKDEFNIVDGMFPSKYGFEEFRLKRYLPNDIDEFRNHVDVNNSL